MPTVREQLSDKVLALLEASEDVTALFEESARDILDKPGWLREFIAHAPADFPRLSLDFSRGTHSMWTRADGTILAADEPTFHEMGGVDFEVARSFVLTITVREEIPDDNTVSAPEEAILQALFVAGTRLGLPAIVDRIGEASFERRETQGNESPQPGTVTTIRLPVFTLESGRALLE